MISRSNITAVDLFCGAGGTSSGFLKAAAELGIGDVFLTAVNHWPTAISTHSLNHPLVRHICEPVENLHPLDLVKGGRLSKLLASCECRFHSLARGGGICNEQSRSQAWQLVRWATDIEVEDILMENIREFLNWGPLLTRSMRYKGKLYKKGRPDPRKRGRSFNAFVNALANLGYKVEWRLQCAADFGDATSRVRLMLMARKHGPIRWPEPTHGPGRTQPWRAAREIIDFSIASQDVIGLDGKPRLCPNTMNRINNYLRKVGGEKIEPFLVMLNGTSDAHINSCGQSLDEPLPTVTCSNRAMLCEPFIVQTDQTGGNGLYARSVEKPLPTIVTKQNMMLVEPFILKYYKTGICKSVSEPLDTITCKSRFMLVECEQGAVGIGLRARMLQPPELARAHSFPTTYKFTGNQAAQTKQIGNSVPVELACAHAKVILE